jgi:hypothetical protein
MMTATTTSTSDFVLAFLGYYGQDLMRPGALHIVSSIIRENIRLQIILIVHSTVLLACYRLSRCGFVRAADRAYFYPSHLVKHFCHRFDRGRSCY